jgi:hypothetical protein
MKFLEIFALLHPDPASESGSGSTDMIESGSNPDPQHCFYQRPLCLKIESKLVWFRHINWKKCPFF